LSCLQQFFKDVIVGDYGYIKNSWPAEIQGGVGIIVAHEDISNFNLKSNVPVMYHLRAIKS